MMPASDKSNTSRSKLADLPTGKPRTLPGGSGGGVAPVPDLGGGGGGRDGHHHHHHHHHNHNHPSGGGGGGGGGRGGDDDYDWQQQQWSVWPFQSSSQQSPGSSSGRDPREAYALYTNSPPSSVISAATVGAAPWFAKASLSPPPGARELGLSPEEEHQIRTYVCVRWALLCLQVACRTEWARRSPFPRFGLLLVTFLVVCAAQ